MSLKAFAHSSLALAALILAASRIVSAQPYQIEILLNGLPSSGYSNAACPVINDLGHVAFSALDANGKYVVLRYTEAGLQVVAHIADFPDAKYFGPTTAINNADQVAFFADDSTRLDSVNAIYRTDGHTPVTVASSPRNLVKLSPSLGMNDSGTVAFGAYGNPFLFTVATGDGGAISPRFNGANTAFLPYQLPVVDLNDSGQIAFSATLNSGEEGVFVSEPNGDLRTIASSLGVLQYVDNPNINTAGKVAFHAQQDQGGDALIVSDGVTAEIKATSQALHASLAGPALNDEGDLLFVGAAERPPFGLSGNIVVKKATGEFITIFRSYVDEIVSGRPVTSVGTCRGGINKSGQVVFSALTSGVFNAIVRATPIP